MSDQKNLDPQSTFMIDEGCSSSWIVLATGSWENLRIVISLPSDYKSNLLTTTISLDLARKLSAALTKMADAQVLLDANNT